jgi:hypothetical protein
MIQKSNRLYEYPPTIERLSPKDNYYNFNIIESEKEDESGNTYLNYDYEQILVDNPVTREKLLRLMVDEGLDSEEYVAMINKDCDDLGIE